MLILLLMAIVLKRKAKGPADIEPFYLPEDHPSVLADISKWADKTHTAALEIIKAP